MSPSIVQPNQERGWIVPVGGAEEKIQDPSILKRFVDISGNGNAHIAVIPTASQLDDTGTRYEEIFRDLGVDRCTSLPYEERGDADRDDWHDILENATGIFFTGGNQLRISTILGGTRVAQTIRKRNASGITVGGTSAGAAILPEHMIAYGTTGETPMAGMVSLAPGLGLTNRFVIDQHFRERDRLGRLLTALSFNPFAVGLGIDENTAAFISPDNVIHVEGAGAVTIVDVADVKHSSVAYADEGEPLCITNVKLHILPQNATYDLTKRIAAPAPRGS
jgi:cyanophycinase